MVTTFDSMPSTWSFLQPAGINPSQCSSHHAEFQMVSNGHCISGLGFGAADIPLQLFETSLNLPTGTVVLDNFLNRQSQVSGKQGNPLRLTENSYDTDPALETLEHANSVIGKNSSILSVKVDRIFPGLLLVLLGKR